jgi:hypothetical protein
MTNPNLLKAAAETYLNGEVIAAGIFGLQDNYGLITAAGAATAVTTDAAGIDNPVADGVAGAAAVHAAREVNAQAQGLDVRMVVAVTESTIHILNWHDGACTKQFAQFDRATARVEITRFGASRRVTLADAQTGQELHLTGSTGFLSSESAGDKLVLALLS